MLEYDTAMIRVHSPTTGHVPGYFNDALNVWAKKGWRLVSVVRVEKLSFAAVFEREKP